jgi:DNA-binding NarL/FixJ family response regulator
MVTPQVFSVGFGNEASYFTKGGNELIKRHKSFDLREEIGERRRERRERKAYIEGLLEGPVRLAKEDPAVGIRALLTLTEGGRRMYSRYLRSRFGYKVWGTDYTFIRCGTLRAERIVRPERMPSDIGEAICFTDALTEWVVWDMAWVSIHKVANVSSGLDEEAFQEMHDVCLLGLVRMFGTSRIRLALSNSYAGKRIDEVARGEQSITWLASWVGAQISLGRNQRLAHSLKEVCDSAFAGLLQELPATTLIELDNLVREAEHPSKLVTLVTRHLEKAGSEAINQKPGKIVHTDHGLDEAINKTPLEEFVAKEKLEALRASTKLSAREDQVLELMLKHYLDREIACELGIDEGSVKTTKFRMRQKLKQAAGL